MLVCSGPFKTRLYGMGREATASFYNYLPISNTMNTIFKFFEPGFTSFIKNKASFAGVAIVSVVPGHLKAAAMSAGRRYFGRGSYKVSFSS